MTSTKTINEHAFTSGLSDSQVATLAHLAHEVNFREDEIVLVAGQQSKHFYLLLEGSVCIEVGARSYTVWVQILNPGDAFGWSALLDHHDTLFQVRAREASRLAKGGVVARQEADQKEADFAVTEAQVAKAQASIATTQETVRANEANL